MKRGLILLAALAAAAFVYFFTSPAFAGDIAVPHSIPLGEYEIRLYGLIMALAILAGYFVARKYSERFGISRVDADNFSFWAVIAGVTGARLYFVLFAWPYFSNNLDEIYKIWHGGLSIYGALIGGLLITFFWTRAKPFGFRNMLDLLGISLPLAQALGRWGNFFNQEAFGYPTDMPWKMFISPEFRPALFEDRTYFHPTFLYESLYLIAVFFLLRSLIGKIKPGVLGLSYLALYSLGRFFIEPLRLDSVWISGFRADQVVSFLAILAAGSLILRWESAQPKNN